VEISLEPVFKIRNPFLDYQQMLMSGLNRNETPLVRQYQHTSPEADLMLSIIIFEMNSDVKERRHIVELLSTRIDWKKFITLAIDNEILPLVYPVLKELKSCTIPDNIFKYLHGCFENNIERNEVLCKELVNLNRLFSSNSIRIINYKGPETTSRIGIDISNRQFNDLDFLVRREQIPRMRDVLSAAGYRQRRDQAEFYKAKFGDTKRKDYTFIKTSSSDDQGPIRGLPQDINEYREIIVEPHLHIIEDRLPLSIDYQGLWNRAHDIEFMGENIRTFSKEDLLFILCVNACKEKWRHLKGVCDIANALRALSDVNIEMCLERAREAGGERMLLMCLLLANELLGVKAYPDAAERAKSDHKLAKDAKLIIYNRSRTYKLGLLPSYPWKFSFLIFNALDRPRDRIKYTWRTHTQPSSIHYKRMPLPKPLHYLYRLLVPVHDLLIWPILTIAKRSFSQVAVIKSAQVKR
jgi:hypothetical protein